METPNYRPYFLIRIKLARTVNEIHGDLLSTFPYSCPGLSTLQRWHTEFDKGVFALEKKTRPGRDSYGVHLQAEAGIDPCTTYRDHSRPEHHDRVPEDDWEELSQPEKDKIWLKDCLLMEFLTRRDVEPVKQSPYSPDLNLCDSTCFLREDEFGGHEEATLAVQRAMRRVSEDELYDQLRKLRGHCHDVIAVGGDYVY
ncbi:Uncharacterized protein FKW44_009320 [Caligus rogercresseyi]|uniref:Uncharacterized protein n=1 Tax=Caligus rogercresseyi TaxID=217165 RepID=A0A7T8K6K4_CALRO|nr:Uncharacterized protein FKW44_009320 [Caligus rogercresseyi]